MFSCLALELRALVALTRWKRSLAVVCSDGWFAMTRAGRGLADDLHRHHLGISQKVPERSPFQVDMEGLKVAALEAVAVVIPGDALSSVHKLAARVLAGANVLKAQKKLGAKTWREHKVPLLVNTVAVRHNATFEF